MLLLSRHLTILAATLVGLTALGAGTIGCAAVRQEREPYTTDRDKLKKGAVVGAAAGAAAAILKGEDEADEILAGAGIGAVIGAGVGLYMDRQEEKLARIPGTSVERVGPSTLLIHFDSDILFDTDSAILDSAGRVTVSEVASVLLEFPKTAVVVQGHTDSTGSEIHNQALSERRAQAVEGLLVARGIDRQRLTAVGYGEGYPAADNDTESGRQRNRRVDVLVKAKAR
ncbi:MAG TPA: OmpA family protein [Thermoanaerobaculia bacterium]|nr:OmpA family protein [Thermoanaerobaculia bacterium]